MRRNYLGLILGGQHGLSLHSAKDRRVYTSASKVSADPSYPMSSFLYMIRFIGRLFQTSKWIPSLAGYHVRRNSAETFWCYVLFVLCNIT